MQEVKVVIMITKEVVHLLSREPAGDVSCGGGAHG